MRQITFRGKRVDNREWVEGSLIQCSSGTYILETDADLTLRPEYHSSGMGCGLEDRSIHDRYDAMAHGWDCAVERFEEVLPCYIEVDPNTIGQATGLHDKNDKMIFEGDILNLTNAETASCEVVYELHGGFSFKWLAENFIRVRGDKPEPIFHNVGIIGVVTSTIHDTITHK